MSAQDLEAMSPQERMREQMRLRREKINSVELPTAEPTPPEQATEQPQVVPGVNPDGSPIAPN